MVLLLVGIDDGGYYADTRRWAALALVAAAALRIVWLGRPRLTRFGVATVLLLGALALWTLASATWGIPGGAASVEAERTLFYAVALAGLLTLAADGAGGLLAGILAGIAGLSVVALVLAAGGFVEPDPFEGTILHQPVGYANALGIVAAIGVLLSVGTAVRPRAARARLSALLAGVPAGVALLLTESRGAWLALACGGAVLTAMCARRPFSWAVPLGLAGAVALSLSLVSLGHRPSYWRAALADARDAPFSGSGAGSFDDWWRAHGTLPVSVRDAHSLYLETLAELGPVGLALLLVALALPLVALKRGGWHPDAAAPAAAYAAWLVHAGLDWDWEVAVTTFAALACATALLTSSDETAGSASARRSAVALRPGHRAASGAAPR